MDLITLHVDCFGSRDMPAPVKQCIISIIRQLSRQLANIAPKLSFFFCQSTNMALNNATAVLQSQSGEAGYYKPARCLRRDSINSLSHIRKPASPFLNLVDIIRISSKGGRNGGSLFCESSPESGPLEMPRVVEPLTDHYPFQLKTGYNHSSSCRDTRH